MTVDKRAELEKLSTEMLEVVFGALHELTCDMREIVADIVWDRHARMGGLWPMRVASIRDPNDRAWPPYGPRREHELVAYCAAGKMPSEPTVHHDDLHVVRRSLVTVSCVSGVECSCGRRSDMPMSSERHLHLKWFRMVPDPTVWPRVLRPENGGHACYQVCRDAPTADHRGHAPDALGERCLCGQRLGSYYDPKSDSDVCMDKFMSVQ